MSNWRPLLTEIEQEVVKREANKPKIPTRSTFVSLHLTIEEPEIPTIRLDEDDMEDTLPGIGLTADETWEMISAGLELGEEVPFNLDMWRAKSGQFYSGDE